MQSILDKYGYTPDAETIARKVSRIQESLDNWNNTRVLLQCLSFVDLTTLNSTDTKTLVLNMVKRVNEFHTTYPEYPLPASICVFPNLIAPIKSSLKADGVAITSVAGGFPTSQTFTEIKIREAEMAIEAGANEIDIVLSLNQFFEGNYTNCISEIKAIKENIGDNILKVIIESGALIDLEKIAAAAFISMEAGADFVKTSTGKLDPGATPSSAMVICESIEAFYKATGKKVGFKAAGGISTSKDAICYYAIIESILGKQWLDRSYFRLGASRLTNNILSEVEQKTVAYF